MNPTSLIHKPEPTIIRPFDDATFRALKEHVAHVRRIFDAPGAIYHDADQPENNRFNRWAWNNLPELVRLHHSVDLLVKAKETFGQDLKPSYSFLSLYGPEGVCPLHRDRPQCQFTIDLQIDSDGQWPIYIEDKPYILEAGEALCYSGTGQKHFRKPMSEDSWQNGPENMKTGHASFMNLAFFHFVPIDWLGSLS